MAIYAIADLHLSLGSDKPMDIFGAQWIDHERRLEEAWAASVREDDTVLIPGDISWGMTMENALPDLQFLDRLPGRKILSKGNHDYWWGTMSKVETLVRTHGLASISFLKNNARLVEGKAICGTRGWISPSDPEFKTEDQTIYERELGRLERSLMAGRKMLGEPGGDIIALLHYPPLQKGTPPSAFCTLLEKYEVKMCVYGHLHGRGHAKAFEGDKNGVLYYMVSGDYISFKPLRL
jgi:predicted phosphohydrolase